MPRQIKQDIYYEVELEDHPIGELKKVIFYMHWGNPNGDEYQREVAVLENVPKAQAEGMLSACNTHIDSDKGVSERLITLNKFIHN